ncbi:MAG: Asp-tRNA(Asn)/Glu-tRNA(Gln) amidotransferase subunit GatB [Chloroflexi bacterium]|nr:Asp-tRNA(Asn)/Glu-tRNA(Gln) amidotransferase subunit GatB [Chloroflexota bacterium]
MSSTTETRVFLTGESPLGKYESVIGLECHVQLATRSKMFCGCPTEYAGSPPNTHVCPVCLGMPGVLPVINRAAVDYTLMTGLAINATIPAATKFDRKNYPYPDLVKGYQISQYDLPLVKGGWIEITVDGDTRRIQLERVHLEEDTGKLTHVPGGSLVDFNRSGVPLMEMVSQPDLRTPAEARAYLQKLRAILRSLGVSGADMEKGQLRCDVNVSLRPVGEQKLGTKVEVKNLNSFRSVQRALEYEIVRQATALDAGETIPQETRGWLDDRGVTVSQRSKEQAHDYRYFPEPDLPPVFVDDAWLNRLRERLPELPDARRARYMAAFGLGGYDAEALSTDHWAARLFEDTVAAGADAKKAANWIQNDVARLRGESDGHALDAEHLAELIKLVDEGVIGISAARQVLPTVYETGRPPRALVEEQGLAQVSDTAALEQTVRDVLEANPTPVADYRAGKVTAINYLKGQVMKASRGKANPTVVEELLKQHLSS